jgi:hypothetical protein
MLSYVQQQHRSSNFIKGRGSDVLFLCDLRTCLLEHRIQLARGKVAVQVRSWGEAHICM